MKPKDIRKKKQCEYCEADMKISKKGNEYCSNICWTKEPFKTQRLEDQTEWEIEADTIHGNWGAR